MFIKGFQLILGKKTLSSRLMRYLAYAEIHTHCAVRPQCHGPELCKRTAQHNGGIPASDLKTPLKVLNSRKCLILGTFSPLRLRRQLRGGNWGCGLYRMACSTQYLRWVWTAAEDIY